jgi:hypothetical protein
MTYERILNIKNTVLKVGIAGKNGTKTVPLVGL